MSASGLVKVAGPVHLVTLHENAGGKTVEDAGDSSSGTILTERAPPLKTDLFHQPDFVTESRELAEQLQQSLVDMNRLDPAWFRTWRTL